MEKRDPRYDRNSYNDELRIQLVDKNNELIQMISQIQAFRLLRSELCVLLMIKPPTVKFQLEREKWDRRFLRKMRRRRYKKTGLWLNSLGRILYGNFHIQSPEGQEMFHCDSQKALWYLNRDAVDIIGENPPTLRFKFKPDGPGHIGDSYYLSEKHNRCVVCGAEDNLSRHHVVPRVFRRYLPEHIKKHNYHDVLLTCIDCHEKYELEAGKFKQQICKELNFDLGERESGRMVYSYVIRDAVSSANALINHGDKIPDPRKLHLLSKVKLFLGKEDITQKDLEEVVRQRHRVWKKPDGYQTYGQYVVDKIGNIQEFTERWRRHFLEIMNPKFLPDYWDINKSIKKN